MLPLLSGKGATRATVCDAGQAQGQVERRLVPDICVRVRPSSVWLHGNARSEDRGCPFVAGLAAAAPQVPRKT